MYEIRCRCKEEFLITKKRKSSRQRKKKPYRQFAYPITYEIERQTFEIKYDQKLSLIAKSILNSFQNKYLYYAIDDILYLLTSNPTERDKLLEILYSPVISLQNNLSINFFNIWINEIYISEVSKSNKFLSNHDQNLEPFSYITIKLVYITKIPIKQQESLW